MIEMRHNPKVGRIGIIHHIVAVMLYCYRLGLLL